jgi:hypothetical protein
MQRCRPGPNAESNDSMKIHSARGAMRLEALLVAFLTIPFHACADGPSEVASESPTAVDSNPAPPAPAPPGTDSVVPPPPDTTTPPPPDPMPPPPPDSSTPPPPAQARCTFPGGSSATPQHVGIAFGPTHVPPPKFGGPYTGTQITATDTSCLLADLEKARRANARVFISFTGNAQYNRDEDGFSLEKWQRRVDRFRNVPLAPYLADGTILGHLVVDEPNDPHEWNGHTISPAEIEEMAKYSKTVWPSMTTFVRAFPEYLEGGQFPHLDALWFQYLDRWAPLDAFIDKHFREAGPLGLKIVTGLNVLNGGSKSSGIPGRRQGKNAMSADEIRSWGGKLLAQSNLCAFLLWEYDEAYLARADIKAAIEDLAAMARSYPKTDCSR